MSRNFYILAAVFAILAAGCLVMSWTPGAHQAALPGTAQMWRMMALVLFLLAALSCFAGTVRNMFEQASRRHEERERHKQGPSA